MAKSYRSIYSALAANVLISVTKFIAGAFTNSSSMISEGIHSLVDTVNELLLLYGLKRSKKKPDHLHPFGYGKELYFWSFIVSILIFGLGGGVSIYQGILHIIHAENMGDPTWNYVVLAASFIFEGTSFIIAAKEFNESRGDGVTWWDAIIKSKDPSRFLVLFEDGAAVLGLLVVAAFMIISHHTGMHWLDGLASVIVGLILIFVSTILARESRSLLMGEGITKESQLKIKALAEKDGAIQKVVTILSTYQSPEDIMLMMIVEFKPHLETEDIAAAIERVRVHIKEEFTLVQYVIIQPRTESTDRLK